MGLTDNIPGLKAHETTVPSPSAAPVPVTISFDAAAAQKAIGEAVEAIAAGFPGAVAFDWLEANRPDIIKAIKATRQDLQAAYDAEDLDRVKRVCNLYVRMHSKAWDVYAQRPPVIETQDVLFGEAA